MSWTAAEFDELFAAVQDELLASLVPLRKYGPSLGRPELDTLNDSNLREHEGASIQGRWRRMARRLCLRSAEELDSVGRGRQIWRKISQAKMAEALGIGQMQISRLEKRKDPRLSTMQRTVAAMRGHLTMIATFPDQEPVVLITSELIEKPAASPKKKRQAWLGRKTAAFQRSQSHELEENP
jgi:transcriptional regulator with XRE-family HTH domain